MIEAGFLLFFILLAVTGVIFWIWMIVECATKEPNQGNDKIVWILIIVLTGWIGGLIYYFVRRPQRIAQYGS
jgi:prolipoprotein diacylglyceryltransferase